MNLKRELEEMYEQGNCSGIVNKVDSLKEEERTPDIMRILAWAHF